LATEVYGNTIPGFNTYSEVVLTKKSIKFQLVYENRHFQISSSPWNDIGFICIFEDITKNIEIVNTLKDSYMFAENLINTANVMIIGLDINGNVNIFNRAAEKLTGYDKTEILGKNWFTEIPILPKDVYEKTYNVFKNLLANEGDESTNEFENPIITKHGEIKYILWQNNEVKKNDVITGTISFGLDVTEQKMNVNELIKAKEKAEESDKLKMAFLANMSHDLRTPINSIIGFSELLKDNDLNKVEKLNYLDIIIQNGDILTNLINDIIDITKIDSGTLKVQKTEIDVNRLLQEMRIQFSKLIKTNKVKLYIDIDLNNSIFILSDKYRIKQILMNLMSNAIKFTKKGSIKFGYKILEKNKLKFYVKDTGIGIDEEDLGKIFQSFARGKRGVELYTQGTGLGLYVAKSFIEMHNGKINVSSKGINKGSTFEIILPVRTEIAKKQEFNLFPNPKET
jgi:PAS domain S-box-containing protein